MAQIHYSEKPVTPHCVAEIWPGGMPHTGGDLRYAELSLGDITVVLDEDEFLELLMEVETTKTVLGW